MIDNKTLEDLFEILEPFVDMNTGASGEGLYGNYCEWQNLESYDDEKLNELQNYFFDKLPKIRYKTREKIICFLRKQGVPEETTYEFGDNFPESQAYFKSDSSDYLFEQFQMRYIQYDVETNSLLELIKKEKIDLIIKSLLFAIFSLTESYVKQVVWNQVPNIEENVNDSFLKELMKKHIDELLKFKDKTTMIGKKLGLNIGGFPHDDLRNVIAHNIALPTINEHLKITYPSGNDTEITKDVFAVINDLKNFAKNIL